MDITKGTQAFTLPAVESNPMASFVGAVVSCMVTFRTVWRSSSSFVVLRV
jgi:hypothetical protein